MEIIENKGSPIKKTQRRYKYLRCVFFWRSGWDSNPRDLSVQLISSQPRYDHFDTAPYDALLF